MSPDRGRRPAPPLAALLLVLLGPRRAAATSEALPPFFDYDCSLVKTRRDALTDWDAVYAWVRQDVTSAKVSDDGGPDYNPNAYKLPDEYLPLVEGPDAERAEEECPLGVMYLAVLLFYRRVEEGAKHDLMLPYANRLHTLLGKFEAYEIALSRWPVFAALDYYSPSHEAKPELYCDGVTGVLDWAELRQLALYWTEIKRNSMESNQIEQVEVAIGQMFFDVLKSPANQNAAQDECMWGFYFLVASQVVAAANRETHHLPPFNSIINSFLVGQPFPHIAGSGWPIFTVLTIFADLNKGFWFFTGDRKYLRGYGDWDLRSDELSPLVSSEHVFLSEGWRSAVREGVESLAGLPADGYALEVAGRAKQRAEFDGTSRPIVQRLVEAALAIVRKNGAGRRLAYVVLLYGASWAHLLKRMARRLWQLQMEHPLFVVAIGMDAAAACEELATSSGDGSAQVVCWSPDSQSQVHRFTAMNVLLHLGIDVLYWDMDTFLLRDPTPRVLAQAEGFDALFAGHADADCVNIGAFYIRANAQTAVWLSQFLAWYHDHPFEIDQRGLHVFLRLPTQRVKIAYPPSDLVEIRAAKLDDVNEVVIFDVGWHGDISRMLIMHWCHRPLALKEFEINEAYNAADAADAEGVDLAVVLMSAAGAPPDSPLSTILQLRAIIEVYRKASPPERMPCW